VAPAGNPELDIPVPTDDAVKAPVVVAVPVKGVCGSDVEWFRSGGAEIQDDMAEVVNVDCSPSPLWSPWCFFGDAIAEVNRLNKKTLFQIMTMVFPGGFADSVPCISGYTKAEIFVLREISRMMLDFAYSTYCALLATFRQYSRDNPKQRHW
jgi:hypothetical protein